MAAVSGQRLENLTKETLTKIRTDQSFDHSHANVVRKKVKACLANQRFQESDPLRPDWRLVLVYPQTAKDHFRRVYHKAIDLIVRAIFQRVNQESVSS